MNTVQQKKKKKKYHEVGGKNNHISLQERTKSILFKAFLIVGFRKFSFHNNILGQNFCGGIHHKTHLGHINLS